MSPSLPGGRTPAFDDSVLAALAAIDPTDFDGLQTPQGRARGAAERRLMADVLLMAIVDARKRGDLGRRRAAQAWLRAEPGFTARECCEALGIDYAAMMKALEVEWAGPKGAKGAA